MPNESTLPVPPWMLEGLLWASLALFLAVLSGVVAAWMLHARARRFEKHLASLARLEELKTSLDRLVANHADLDLRRLEHVLIDLRDGQRRLEDRLLAVIEAAHAADARPASPETHALAAPGGASALADRIVTRLLALGYERVQLVTPIAELGAHVEGDGEVLIEARRDGAPCKGRIVIRRGTIADVQIQAAYSIFP